MRPLLVAAALTALAGAARAGEAVLVYLPEKGEVDAKAVREAVAAELRKGGREVVDGAVDRALAIGGGDGGAGDGGAPDAAAIAGLKAKPSVEAVAALARALGLDGVLVVAAGLDAGKVALAGQRFDARTGALTEVRTADGTIAEAARALVARIGAAKPGGKLAVLEEPAIASPRPAPEVAAAEKDRTPWYRKPILWVAVFAVGVAAVLLASLYTPPAATGTVIIDTKGFSGR